MFRINKCLPDILIENYSIYAFVQICLTITWTPPSISLHRGQVLLPLCVRLPEMYMFTRTKIIKTLEIVTWLQLNHQAAAQVHQEQTAFPLEAMDRAAPNQAAHLAETHQPA